MGTGYRPSGRARSANDKRQILDRSERTQTAFTHKTVIFFVCSIMTRVWNVLSRNIDKKVVNSVGEILPRRNTHRPTALRQAEPVIYTCVCSSCLFSVFCCISGPSEQRLWLTLLFDQSRCVVWFTSRKQAHTLFISIICYTWWTTPERKTSNKMDRCSGDRRWRQRAQDREELKAVVAEPEALQGPWNEWISFRSWKR